MKTLIEILPEAADSIRALAPEPCRKLRLAIRGLEHGRGDIQPLRDELEGLQRLRVDDFRIIFREYFRGQRVVRVVFVMKRSFGYEALAQLLLDELDESRN
jgi:mRNA-degrading endonuclease RelE of RelBE toxin-antitoxin system